MTSLGRGDHEEDGKVSGEAGHVCIEVGQSSSRRAHLLFLTRFDAFQVTIVCPRSSLRPREIESKAQNCFTPLHRREGRTEGRTKEQTDTDTRSSALPPSARPPDRPIPSGRAALLAPVPAHALTSRGSLALTFKPHEDMDGERWRYALIGFWTLY